MHRPQILSWQPRSLSVAALTSSEVSSCISSPTPRVREWCWSTQHSRRWPSVLLPRPSRCSGASRTRPHSLASILQDCPACADSTQLLLSNSRHWWGEGLNEPRPPSESRHEQDNEAPLGIDIVKVTKKPMAKPTMNGQVLGCLAMRTTSTFA